jgi:hypothetical protein
LQRLYIVSSISHAVFQPNQQDFQYEIELLLFGQWVILRHALAEVKSQYVVSLVLESAKVDNLVP